MSKKIIIHDSHNETITRYGLKAKRIDICESHTIIYEEGDSNVTLHLPFSLKSICFQEGCIMVYWLNDFYAIIENA